MVVYYSSTFPSTCLPFPWQHVAEISKILCLELNPSKVGRSSNISICTQTDSFERFPPLFLFQALESLILKEADTIDGQKALYSPKECYQSQHLEQEKRLSAQGLCFKIFTTGICVATVPSAGLQSSCKEVKERSCWAHRLSPETFLSSELEKTSLWSNGKN